MPAITGGGVPPLPITSQPTTPITSPVVDRRITADERRSRARRMSDRASTRRELLRTPAVLWLLLAVIGSAAGALYYYSVRGFASARQAEGTLAAETAAITLRDTVAGAPVIAPPPVFVTPGDSGDVRVVGTLPPGTTFYVDDRHVDGPITRVPAGRHVVGIWAPGYEFWSDTVDVVAGRLHEITPRLQLPARAAEPAPPREGSSLRPPRPRNAVATS
jgi:hypothetical protein